MSFLFGADDSSQNTKKIILSPLSPQTDITASSQYIYTPTWTTSTQNTSNFTDARANTYQFSPSYIITSNSPDASISSKKSDSASSSSRPSIELTPSMTTSVTPKVNTSSDQGTSAFSMPSTSTLLVIAVIGVGAFLLIEGTKRK